ncbi:diguanylate cyclase [Actinotalea sp.]|uniref:sensor domain-containing diguanylate cyclase n=1 Tax=Actinotalea sp. TaxID=1872145 RepID=UPI00356B3FFF
MSTAGAVVLQPAEVAAGFGDLPTLAPVAVEMIRLADGDRASIEDIATVISRDPALAAQVLRVANSPVYGMGGSTTSLARAASVLGLRTLKLLSLTFSVLTSPDASEPGAMLVWRHTLATSALAQVISSARDPRLVDECFIVGLLGNLGRLALTEHLDYADAARAAGHWLDDVDERAAVGCTSDEVTGEILDRWGLPGVLSDAVRHRNRPEGTQGAAARIARVLSVADAAARLVVATPDRAGAALEAYQVRAAELLDLTEEETDGLLVGATPALEEIADMFRTERPHEASLELLLLRAKESLAALSPNLVAALATEQSRSRQLEAENRRLEAAALTDTLTALPNRRAYDAFIERIVAGRRRRGATWALGLLMIDLDGFKAVNDTHGHSVGDDVLRQIGARLAEHTRSDEFAARIGGEEFVVVAPVTDPDEIALAGERLRAAVASVPVATPVGPLTVTASVGAAWLDDVAPGATRRVFEAADAALREAKSSGRNCVVTVPVA